jgi:uncharacterized protein (TIGR02145 family)
MKKLITLILGIALVYSCSTGSDENSNTTTSVVPIAPSNLIGTVAATTQINLSWTDNSTNETGFKIERKTGNGTYAVVGTTATNVTTFNDSGAPNTTYTYRVYSNNSSGNSLTYTNELTLTTANIINLPSVTTSAASSITTSTALSGGAISNDGGAAVTIRGVCWNTSPNPTISLSTKTINGTGIGAFTSNITSLSANTTYYLRAYATNSVGTSYGNEVSFITASPPTITVTDIDGNTYQTVTICNQIWTKTNLKVTKYRNGDIIPQITDPTQWASLTTGAWCYYANTTSNGTTYGKLYNWYAVNDSRGLAPTGYHIPTDTEWTTLTTCLGGPNGAAGKMKELGTSHWLQPNTGATNSSGFTGLPGGMRSANGFIGITLQGYWWSSTLGNNGTISGWLRWILYDNVNVQIGSGNKVNGLSIRCVKD